MAEMKEYSSYDGIGLAELVQKKEVSAKELFHEAIKMIEERNPKINAVVTKMFDQGLKTAENEKLSGPFCGVPFLLKDMTADYAGVPSTKGSRAYKDYIPDHDSELVKRFKDAGLVIIGKTNCPEFGLKGVTEPELFGATRNPWNLDHTCGGSSGGSAAAVASEMVPMASAGDGGGSIRIPASCCGLFGLKPSRGRVPTGPQFGALWQGATATHIISRSVRDTAAMLDAVEGKDIGAPYYLPSPEKPFLDEAKTDPGKLKIAFTTKSPLGTEVDEECITAIKNTASLLEKLGHHVEEDTPGLDGKALARSYFMMYFGEMAADLKEIKSYLNRKVRSDEVELVTHILALMGETFSAGDFVYELRQWAEAGRIMGKFHEQYDLYLTPTTAAPPVKIGELDPKPAEIAFMKLIHRLKLGKLLRAIGLVDKMAVDSLSKTPFTQLANFTGQPAMSVPMHWTKDNLPCGVQFFAPIGDESTLFRLAGQLEQEQPWFDKRPNL